MLTSPLPKLTLADRIKSIGLVLFSPEKKLARIIEQARGNYDNPLIEGIFTLRKYHADSAAYDSYSDFLRHNDPYAVSQFANGLLLTGVQAMYAMAIGNGTSVANTAYATPTFYSNAQSCIGVAESLATFANSQTGLQGSSKSYAPMMSTYPSIGTSGTANVITFQASFSGTVANIAWNEFCIFNSPADTYNSVSLGGNAIALNRAVSSQGTKGSGSTWQLTYTLTIS